MRICFVIWGICGFFLTMAFTHQMLDVPMLWTGGLLFFGIGAAMLPAQSFAARAAIEPAGTLQQARLTMHSRSKSHANDNRKGAGSYSLYSAPPTNQRPHRRSSTVVDECEAICRAAYQGKWAADGEGA
jgi:hypothetical protein